MVSGYIAGVAFGSGTEYLRVFQVAGCVAFTGYALDGLLYGLLTGGTFGWLWPR